jgi:hypothetical protein
MSDGAVGRPVSVLTGLGVALFMPAAGALALAKLADELKTVIMDGMV